jgi:predicted DNA-binding protein with PD1-like motif
VKKGMIMKASEGHLGRVFVIRLEDGDIVPDCIENFAEENGVSVGHVVLIGGIGKGRVVVGPRDSDERPPEPVLLPVDGAHEVVGVGVMAPGQDGKPVLHIHASLGRSGQTMTGCLRPGVKTWLVGEVILCEILGAKIARVKDEKSGLALLEAGDAPAIDQGGLQP